MSGYNNVMGTGMQAGVAGAESGMKPCGMQPMAQVAGANYVCGPMPVAGAGYGPSSYNMCGMILVLFILLVIISRAIF
ncbi:hypothetical protein IDH44_17125 [Paenibacillus sp. IB182496]|uniref:Sporulation protein YjcZ n=1 Tax=Paenibacillus sabuli TaxID=2772509 RepID=A0A927BV61_9BACL|nr:hypothetical protein [Paenibacillus sabuli]MBD2846922.1 hypothetical protein [Paenibacillus sabuli]